MAVKPQHSSAHSEDQQASAATAFVMFGTLIIVMSSLLLFIPKVLVVCASQATWPCQRLVSFMNGFGIESFCL